MLSGMTTRTHLGGAGLTLCLFESLPRAETAGNGTRAHKQSNLKHMLLLVLTSPGPSLSQQTEWHSSLGNEVEQTGL